MDDYELQIKNGANEWETVGTAVLFAYADIFRAALHRNGYEARVVLDGEEV